MSRRNSTCAITNTRPGWDTRPVREAALAGQQGQLADEAARPELGDDDLIGTVWPNDLHFALQDDKQVVRRLPGLEEQVPSRVSSLGAERGHVRELGTR